MGLTLPDGTAPKRPRLKVGLLLVAALLSSIYAVLFRAGWQAVVLSVVLVGILSVVVPYVVGLTRE